MVELLRSFGASKGMLIVLGTATVFGLGGWQLWSRTALLSSTDTLSQPQAAPVVFTMRPAEFIAGTSKAMGAEAPSALAKPQSTAPPLESAAPAADFVPKERAKGKDHVRPNELLASMIRQLHAEAYEQFIRAPGNGAYRWIPTMKITDLPWKTPDWTSEELAKEPPPPKELNDVNLIHRLSLSRFANSNGNSEKVNGNRFGILDMNSESNPLAKDKTNRPAKKEYIWQIKSLDLVGIVMHETPVVYVSDKIPEMKDLKNKKTRTLDLFESEGIEELMNGKKLYLRGQAGTIRVLGPIQAGTACLKCHHDSKEGDLLGAFSYTLRTAQFHTSGTGGQPVNSQFEAMYGINPRFPGPVMPKK
jgi:hypothetical protein